MSEPDVREAMVNPTELCSSNGSCCRPDAAGLRTRPMQLKARMGMMATFLHAY